MRTAMIISGLLLGLGCGGEIEPGDDPSLAQEGKRVTWVAPCNVSPNPTPLGAANTISGGGFAPYTGVGITVKSAAGDIAVSGTSSDASGNYSQIMQGVWLGTNTVTVNGSVFGSRGRLETARATCTFDVTQ